MGNTDYSAFTQPTSQLATDVLSHWQEIRSQTGDNEVVESFEQRLLSLTSRVVAIAEIGGQQMQPGKQGQRSSALTGSR